MQITNRDLDIIEFINFCPTTCEILTQKFQSDYRNMNRRLLKLYNYGYIKRSRGSYISSPYIYYNASINRPKHLEHAKQLSAFIVYYSQFYNITNVYREKKIYKGIRPDGLIVLTDSKGNQFLNIVEVELTTNPNSKIPKYIEYYKQKKYLDYCDTPPKLIFITHHKEVSDRTLEKFIELYPIFQ